MSWFGKYLKSSVGAKHVMAVTGLLLVGFVLQHMIGNLQMFAGLKDPHAGQNAVNSYAAGLKSLGPLLWVARGGLIAIALIHIYSAIRLVSMNRAARPVAYKMVHHERSSFASRAMAMSGIIVLAFLAFHLVHFTLGGGPLQENFNLIDSYGRHDVYNMTVLGFQQPIVAGAYLAAMLLLCLHLKHGVTSLFQSLGLNHPKYNGIIGMAGPLVALLVLVGNCSMPIAVLAGWIKVAL
jgi:succinate dehydrogenase / fumarate reductase cytochrome b subunit